MARTRVFKPTTPQSPPPDVGTSGIAPVQTITVKVDAKEAIDAVRVEADRLIKLQADPYVAPMPNTFIRMNSGDTFHYNDIESNTFSLHDFAYNLSRINRFHGATLGKPYSVAQHSCHVGDYLLQHFDPLTAFIGLLHDGHEAVIGDIPTPLKKAFKHYGLDVNERFAVPIDEWLFKSAGVTLPLPQYVVEAVQMADMVLYQHEGRQLMRNFVPSALPPEAPPYTSHITPWASEEAYRQFLSRFQRWKPLAVNQSRAA